MNRKAWCVFLFGPLLAGCGTAKKVAVSSFRVVDAPAAFIRNRIDNTDRTITTTTTTTSDVANPGYPVMQTPPPAQRPAVTERRTVNATPRPQVSPRPQATPRRISPSPTPRTAASAPLQFPVARPVPGRPGYVYSLDPNGGMIDVTGYKPGDKAKDPYTKQIFIIP